MNEDDCTLRQAATILILRDSSDGPQVFLVRRHSASAFMADRYVYPGGTVDPDDCGSTTLAHVEGLSPEDARRRLDEDASPQQALALFLAGIRETFEEAGILLARRRHESKLIDLTGDPQVAKSFEIYRRQLHEGEISLTDLAEREDLVFPLDRLGYFAHWITPLAESRRYDTRFFVALAPERQEPLHDAQETTDSTWIAPRDAIARNRQGAFQLAPPTLCTLQRLEEFASARAAFEWSLNHDPPTILPHLEQRNDTLWLLLPGDPDFPSDRPEYLDLEPVDQKPTRLVARDIGLWEAPKRRDRE